MAKLPKQKVVPFKRTVDPQGTDKGAAREIEDLAARKKALSGLEPTPPKFGNPVEQVKSAYRAVKRRLNSTGNAVSPTTTKDQGHAGPSSAELEKIARKYVD